MDKDTYRLNRLRKLVDDAGGPAKFARLSRSIDPNNPIDPTYVSQVLNGHRSFKETAVPSQPTFGSSNSSRPASMPLAFPWL